MKTKVIALTIAVLVIGGGMGWVAARMFMGPAEDRAIALAPMNSVVYANFFLDPSRDQKRAVESLLEKFEEAPTPDQARNKLAMFLDDAFEGSGITYSKDVEPWLGHQIAFFGSSFDPRKPVAAALIATEDPAATQAMIDKLDEHNSDGGTEYSKESYKGVGYRVYDATTTDEIDFASGFLEGFWVAGTPGGFEAAVDASRGDSLAKNGRYISAVDGLARDGIFSYYVDLGPVLDELVSSGQMTEEDLAGLRVGIGGLDTERPTAGILYVRADGVVFEQTAGVSEEGGTVAGAPRLMEELPEGSWLAFGAQDLGPSLQGALDSIRDIPEMQLDFALEQFRTETGLELEGDILSWMGDFGFFVKGTGALSVRGGVLVESSDPEGTAIAVDRLRAFIVHSGATVEDIEIEGLEGFAVPIPQAPERVVVMGGAKLVIAYGEDAAAEAAAGEPSLADDEAFEVARRSLGDGVEASFFLDVDAVTALVEPFVGGEARYQEDVKPWLDPFTFVISGSKVEGDTVLHRAVIGLE